MNGMFQRKQALRHKCKEMLHKLFYQHGLFCASHPYLVIFISGLFIISFSFPAFSVLQLAVGGTAPVEFTSSYDMTKNKSSLPINRNDQPPVWLSGTPLAIIQQVVFLTKGSSKRSSSDFSHLQAAFVFSDLLNQLSFKIQSGQEVTWKDVCLDGPNVLASLSCGDTEAYQDTRHSNECLLLGPDLFWQRSPLSFQQDGSKENTIVHVTSSLSCLPKFVIRELMFGGTYSDVMLSSQKKAFAVTLLLNGISITDSQRFNMALKSTLMKNELYAVGTSNETVHLFYSGSFANMAEVVFIVLLYVIVLLYITFSVGKIEMVKSKWGLGFTAVITTLCSLTVSLGVCVKFRQMPTLNGGEVFPYLVILVGLENILVLVKAVISTPRHLDVNRRIAQGWSVEGWSIFKNFLSELALFFIGYLTGHPVLQEFCLLAIAGVSSDFLLQTFFFTSVLSIDIRQMEIVDVTTQKSLYSSEFMEGTGGTGGRFVEPVRSASCHKPSLTSALTSTTNIGRGVETCSSSNGHIPSSRLHFMGSVASARTPKRLSLAYFIARTRLVQKIVMISFMCYVVYLLYSSVFALPAVGTKHSEQSSSLSMALPTASHNGEVKGPADNVVVKLFAMEALQEAYKRNLHLLARQHWPLFFKLYNKTINGRYVKVLPPLFVQASSDDSHISVGKTQLQDDRWTVDGWHELLPDPLRLINILSGDPDMSPRQKTVAFATIFILFTAVGLWYVIQLYKCVVKAALLSKETRHSQIFPHLRPVTFKEHKQEVECIALDNSCAVSSCLDGEIRVWDLASGHCMRRIYRWSTHRQRRKFYPQKLSSVQRCTENDGLKHRGTSLPDRGLDVQNCIAAGEMNVAGNSKLNGHMPDIAHAEIPWSMAVENMILAVGYGDGVIEVHDLKTGAQCSIDVCDWGVLCCGFASASIVRLVVGRMDGSICFYSINVADDGAVRYKCTASIQAHHEPVSHLKCGGGYAVSGGADYLVQVFNVDSCSVVAKLIGHKNDITALYLHVTSKTVVSGSADCTVRLWQISQNRQLWTADGHKTAIQSVDRNHDIVLSTAADGEVRMYDALSGHASRVIQQACEYCLTSALLHNNVVVCGSKGCIVIYDSLRGEFLKAFELREADYDEIRSTVQRMIPTADRSGILCSFGSQLKLVNLPVLSNST